MKNEMDSFDVAAAAVELDSMLRGARIDNIYQISHKMLLLKFRGLEAAPTYLILEAGRRFHLTSYDFKKPQKPSHFSMVLRKHLRNGRIKSIQQYEFERILVINIQRGREEYSLISEFFSNGNIILVGSDGRIIQALTYRRMRDRNILRGETFKYPPPSGINPRKLRRKDLDDVRCFPQMSIVRALIKLLSISGLYAEEILLRAGINKETPCRDLSKSNLDMIFQQIQGILSEVEVGRMKPSIFIDEDEGVWVNIAPTQLRIYAHLKCESYDTFNRALDEYYTRTLIEERVNKTMERCKHELTRLKRILKRQEEALRNLRERVELNRLIGDIIYRHLNELKALSQWIMESKRKGKAWTGITKEIEEEKRRGKIPALYFQTLTPKELTLQVSLENKTFKIDLKRTIQENAAKYYEEAKKAQRKIIGAEAALKETLSKIEEAERRMLREVEEAHEPIPRKPKRAWYEKFRWFVSSDGFLVLGGRDATQNEILVKRYMESEDIFVHANLHGAPAVIVKAGGREITASTLEEAFDFAASYSKAWKHGISFVDVYWVKPEQVSKTPKHGEYLPKGAFVIRGKRNYGRGRVEIAIGFVLKEHARVIAGPVPAIASKTKYFLVLVPGRKKGREIVREIKERIVKMVKASEREKVKSIEVDEIQRFLPSGGSRVKDLS